MKMAKVYIVGAGPGDFDLLTLKAKKIIEEADCIIYDRLINSEIINLAKEDANLIYLGKENTEGGLIQEKINKTLIEKAKENKIVVRLKGGDPFVFGRGGEEIEELVKNNIDFEVIPGITSSISVPAYAGIPVTHRGISRSFHVFTGHTMEDGKWHNFENISKLEGTLIFLMGIKNLNLIVSDLIKNGKNPSTPVAIIEKGATKKQRVITGKLENILEIAKEKNVVPPAITIIGEVVNLRKNFKWFEKKLSSKNILITRDENQAEEMKKIIEKNGYKSSHIPFIKIKKNNFNIKDYSKYKAILFNSPNGVRAFFENLDDIRFLSEIKIGVVGEKTKEEFKKLKIIPDFMPDKYLVDELARESIKYTAENDNILIITSDISPCDNVAYSNIYKRNFEKIVAYETQKIKVEKNFLLKKLEDVDVITFLSSSTVEAFFESLEEDYSSLENKIIASIGPMTSKTIKKYGVNVDIEAKVYTATDLIKEIIFNLGENL